ncbi:MAG: N-acetylmuramoyl-L-alanine amidase [Candidatus Moraniibacteriota bacterium]
MTRTLLIVGSVLLLLIVGGFWLYSRQKETKSYENKSIESFSEEESLPSVDPLIEEKIREEEPAQSMMPTPPPGIKEDSSSQAVEAPASATLDIVPRLLGFGYREASDRSIDTVVIHSSYNASGGDVYDIDKIIKQYEDYGVGAHYLIGRAGTVYRLVAEKNIAYHAGVSKVPDGRKNVNDFSLGIELDGTETSGYTGKQYDALNALLTDIKSRYKIKFVVGHADIAPGRKTDPWSFDWKRVK